MTVALAPLYLAMGGSGTPIQVVIPGQPLSKARPRYTRTGRTYSDPANVESEKRTATFLRAAIPRPLDGSLAVVCLFVRPDRRRIDTDNMVKHILDAGNRGKIWRDDVQVTAVAGLVELDRDNPHTTVLIGPHRSTMDRTLPQTVPCAFCGEPTPRRPGWGVSAQYCSSPCKASGLGYAPDLATPVPCRTCGKPFRRRTAGNANCSEDCRRDEMRGRARGRRHGNTCDDCGRPLAQRSAIRCRDCWRKSLAAARLPKPR